MRYINNVVIQYNNNVDIQLLCHINEKKYEKILNIFIFNNFNIYLFSK
jgi:hypothetical protein